MRRFSSSLSPKIALEAMASQVEIKGRSEACCCALLDKNKKSVVLSNEVGNGWVVKEGLSSGDSSGSASVTLTFSADTDPDIAQVQVQNSLQQVSNRLPTAVQNQGTSVTKSTSGFMSVTNLYSPDGSMSAGDIQDYANSNIKDILSRVNGVSEVTIFGPSYAMRTWLDPAKLNSYSLTPVDVSNAISVQNSQVTVGQLGGTPAVDSQLINATITAQSLLTSVEEFENILIKVDSDGSQITLKDVARVELASEDSSVIPAYMGNEASGIAITLATGTNSLDTQNAVDEKLAQLSKGFPGRLELVKSTDNNLFIRLSVYPSVKWSKPFSKRLDLSFSSCSCFCKTYEQP